MSAMSFISTTDAPADTHPSNTASAEIMRIRRSTNAVSCGTFAASATKSSAGDTVTPSVVAECGVTSKGSSAGMCSSGRWGRLSWWDTCILHKLMPDAQLRFATATNAANSIAIAGERRVSMKLTIGYANLTRTLSLLAVLHIVVATPAIAQINVVRDLGCKLDDWKFDNGPLLNAAFAKVGSASQGLNEEFYIPGGALVFKTPLVLPRKTGFAMRGNGITFGIPEAA